MSRISRVVADPGLSEEIGTKYGASEYHELCKDELLCLLVQKDNTIRSLRKSLEVRASDSIPITKVSAPLFRLLSEECILMVALHLKPKHLFRLMCVSKKLRAIVDDDLYWERVVVHALYFDTGLCHDFESLDSEGDCDDRLPHRNELRYKKLYFLFEGYKAAIDSVIQIVHRKFASFLHRQKEGGNDGTHSCICLKDMIVLLMALHTAQAQYQDLIEDDDDEGELQPLSFLFQESEQAFASSTSKKIFQELIEGGSITPIAAFHRKLEEYPISVKAKIDMLTLFRAFLFNASIAMVESNSEQNKRAASLVRGLSQSSALRVIQDDYNTVRSQGYRGYDPLFLYPGSQARISYDLIDGMSPPLPL